MKDNILLERGDCLEALRTIPTGSVDMILCDLPYGQTARNKWDTVIPFAPLWDQYGRVIKDNGAIVLFANGMFTADLMQSNRGMWRYNLVWRKTQPTGFLNANRMPLRGHEDICVFYKKPPLYHAQKVTGYPRKVSTAEHKRASLISADYREYIPVSYDSTERYPTSVLTFSKDIQKSALLPTQKPVALLEWLIKAYTLPGETVLDSCMGSGSTGVASMNTGKRFIGIEIDPEYFAAAEKRIRATPFNYGGGENENGRKENDLQRVCSVDQ